MLSQASGFVHLILLTLCLFSIFPANKTQDTIIFGDTSLPPEIFTLSEFMTVNYEFDSNNTIIMAIRCSMPNQYFGLGLGGSMTDSDIWVFEIIDSQVRASDYYSARATRPTLDTARGGQSDLELLGYEIASTYTLVKVRRALDTGDEGNDKVINLGLNNFIYATGNSPTMVYHTRAYRGAAEITLVRVERDTVGEEEGVIESSDLGETEVALTEEQDIAEENFIEEQQVYEEQSLVPIWEEQTGLGEIIPEQEEYGSERVILVKEQEQIVEENIIFEEQEMTEEESILMLDEGISEEPAFSGEQDIGGENIPVEEEAILDENMLIEEEKNAAKTVVGGGILEETEQGREVVITEERENIEEERNEEMIIEQQNEEIQESILSGNEKEDPGENVSQEEQNELKENILHEEDGMVNGNMVIIGPAEDAPVLFLKIKFEKRLFLSFFWSIFLIFIYM